MTQVQSENTLPGGKPATVYLSLGSNLGDRLTYLREALRYLEQHESVELVKISSVYETDPVGLTDQPAFLNIVVQICTTLPPLMLLVLCHEAENHFQRERTVRWGPRTIDIDLLTYDEISMNTPELVLPHPYMQDREFVQVPLHELETGEINGTESVRPLYSHWYS
jgi:2-amino-4-hydroxy-6-hydroxymethyldihydropteridine diphosphokinase